MSKFPFVVEPRVKAILEKVGSEEAGYIEIKRQGYLTVAEKSAFQQITSSQDTTSEILALTRRIASDKGIDMEQAYSITTNCLTGRASSDLEVSVSSAYTEEINALTTQLLLVESNQRMVRSYIMAAFRLDPEITYEDMGTLHPDIVDGLVELFEDEEAKSTKRLQEALLEGKDPKEESETEAISQLEEAEKKPRKRAKQASTSRRSTGN